MKKIGIFTALATALTLTANAAQAKVQMEECKVVKDGKGLIKANKSDCKSMSHSCSGQNKEGDPEAWILVPKGQCTKINNGDFSGVDKKIQDKVEK